MKQPVGIWVTDTHLSENTVEINKHIFSQLFTLCEQLGVHQIFHGGDIFTSRKGQPEVVLNAFKGILDAAAEKQVRILAIPGNHDKTSYVSDSSYLDAFNGHPALTVLEAGSSLRYDHGTSMMNIFFLPYFDESLMYGERLQQIVGQLADDELNILFTHIGIDGVKNNGHVNIENDVKQDLFDMFYLVFVGHYHDRQTLGSRDHIVYTGSAYQANFGEDDQKGCTVLYDDGSFEFINLDFPQYITIEVLPEDLTGELIQMATNKLSESKIKFKVKQEIGDDKKPYVAELEKLGVKVEIEKESFTPLENIGASQVTFTDNDILTSYGHWSVDRKIENADFGKSILSEVL